MLHSLPEPQVNHGLSYVIENWLKVVSTFGQICESTLPRLYAHRNLMPPACYNLQGPMNDISVSCPNVAPIERERDERVRQQESKTITFIAVKGS